MEITYIKRFIEISMNLYDAYSEKIKHYQTFLNFSHLAQLNIISDPLHLLKRARYRLISSKVHSGFYNDSQIIDINNLQALFNYPSVVFSNSTITKMHDIIGHKIV